jgi:hypothetical protein
MRRFCFLALVICLALAAQARGVDLAKINRSLHKEPTYKSKQPQYCLLVFGPQAKTRVWVVLDGDVLYVDRNGNGDLTDPGERIAGEEFFRIQPGRHGAEVRRRFELTKARDEPILTSGPGVQRFLVIHSQQEEPYDFVVTTKAGHRQRAKLRFAASPQEAPVLHFDGPRRFAFSGQFAPPRFRPGESCALAVELHTQGWNAEVRTELVDVPENIHPVAEIEFPQGWPGEGPMRMRVELKYRCSGCVFYGPVRAPYGAGSGMARITLSYPGLEEWNVLPTTLEVPVEGQPWRGWLWHYGPWGLGAVFVLGMAWFVIRRKARRGRTWCAGLVAVLVLLGAAAWLPLPPRTGAVAIEVSGPAGTKFQGWYEVDRKRHDLSGTTPATFPLEGHIVKFSITALEGTGTFSVKVHVEGRAPGWASGKLPRGAHGWVQCGRFSPSYWIEPFDPKSPERWRAPQ